jgi:hypothetical protein
MLSCTALWLPGIAAAGHVFDRVRDECHRLDRRMRSEVVEAPRAERVDAGIMPDIGARTAMVPQLDVIEVGPLTEHELA